MPPRLPLMLTAAVPLLALLLLAPGAFAALLLNGVPAALTLLGATGWGSLVLRWTPHLRPAQQIVLALAIGTGLIGHAALLLSVLGLLTQPTAAVLVATGVALGLWTLKQQAPLEPAAQTETNRWDLFWDCLPPLATAWPLGVLLFAATLPPGTFWISEARGYDALEYHLQGPREWFLAGQMTFLPHNVYTSFPQQVEILYLLLMHLVGDPDIAAIASQILHALLTVAAVAALVVFVPPGLPRRVTWCVVGTVPWLVIVGSLAYVESGLLLFAAVAGGLLLHGGPTTRSTLLLAGACAGFAGGCKYTALAFVGVALPLTWLATSTGTWRDRLIGFVLLGVMTGVTFAPWAARNYAFTGNPVYPFAYSVFGGLDWTPEQDEQWARGHAPKGVDAAHVVREMVGQSGDDKRPGWKWSPFAAFWIAAGLGLLTLRSRAGLAGALWCGLVLAIWLGLTHVPGRFAIVALAPVGLLLAGACQQTWGRRLLPVAAGIVVVCGWLALGQSLSESAGYWLRRDLDPRQLAGRPQDFRAAQVLNELPPGARLWLIGDAVAFYIDRPLHYTVVFSRDPWLTFASENTHTPAQIVDWLRERGWTHVAVQWPEVKRLRDTYGFPEIVQPEWFLKLQQEGGLRPVLPEAQRSGHTVWELPPSGS